MPQFFYRYLAILMALLGAGLSIGLYTLHVYISQDHPESQILACSVLTLLFSVIGFICGAIINRLHLGTYTDPLTNLWNQRYFYTKLNQELQRNRRMRSPFCLAMIDVDNFKQINDVYGHMTGDEVLKNLADLFMQQTRSVDSVIRLGGDEFAILFTETEMDKALLAAERIRRIAAQSKMPHRVTISIGIISVSPCHDADTLLRAVDKTLYEAKKVKNKVISA